MACSQPNHRDEASRRNPRVGCLHSRPHKMRTDNDFDVLDNFVRAASQISKLMSEDRLQLSGRVKRGDCRSLPLGHAGRVDAVITSPPYLNAIDYLRGHKLALVWMGHSIPELRRIRAASLGTERAHNVCLQPELRAVVQDAVPLICKLPKDLVLKYSVDADDFLKAMRTLILPGGKLITVLGNSNLRGCFVENSALYRTLATRHGFVLNYERERPLLPSRRYLPITSASSALAKRMRCEVVQQYVLAA